jgi:hypothetical protein
MLEVRTALPIFPIYRWIRLSSVWPTKNPADPLSNRPLSVQNAHIGLGKLFAKLQQGVVENQQVITIARLRADAEDAYGDKLKGIAPAAERPDGFARDEGASTRKVRHPSIHPAYRIRNFLSSFLLRGSRGFLVGRLLCWQGRFFLWQFFFGHFLAS